MIEPVPILEFDPDRSALIDPTAGPPIPGLPRAAVGCHSPRLVQKLAEAGDLVMSLPSLLPLWVVEFEGEPLGVFYPGQGASLAAVTVERVLGAGAAAIVACGGAGALVPGLPLGHVVIVDAAVRDEGTSYHYLAPSREVAASPSVVDLLCTIAADLGVVHTVGKVWTTDGLFRETPGRVQQRRAEGCVVVDAEAAALLAVAEFRGVPIGQVLFAGDDLSGDRHDQRGWLEADDAQRHVFELAARAALALAS